MWNPFRRGGGGEGVSRQIEPSHDAVSDIKRGHTPKEAWGEDSDPDLRVGKLDEPQMNNGGHPRVSIKEPRPVFIDEVADPYGKTPEDLLIEAEEGEDELWDGSVSEDVEDEELDIEGFKNEDRGVEDEKSEEKEVVIEGGLQSNQERGGMVLTSKRTMPYKYSKREIREGSKGMGRHKDVDSGRIILGSTGERSHVRRMPVKGDKAWKGAPRMSEVLAKEEERLAQERLSKLPPENEFTAEDAEREDDKRYNEGMTKEVRAEIKRENDLKKFAKGGEREELETVDGSIERVSTKIPLRRDVKGDRIASGRRGRSMLTKGESYSRSQGYKKAEKRVDAKRRMQRKVA